MIFMGLALVHFQKYWLLSHCAKTILTRRRTTVVLPRGIWSTPFPFFCCWPTNPSTGSFLGFVLPFGWFKVTTLIFFFARVAFWLTFCKLRWADAFFKFGFLFRCRFLFRGGLFRRCLFLGRGWRRFLIWIFLFWFWGFFLLRRVVFLFLFCWSCFRFGFWLRFGLRLGLKKI